MDELLIKNNFIRSYPFNVCFLSGESVPCTGMSGEKNFHCTKRTETSV